MKKGIAFHNWIIAVIIIVIMFFVVKTLISTSNKGLCMLFFC
jgi:t-SNARE complex subunit (syntaxin)